MKILIACEYTGITKAAFAAADIDCTLVSCDILPARPHPFLGVAHDVSHRVCDVRELLNDDWDMIIAYPPPDQLKLIVDIAEANAEFIAIENPAHTLEILPKRCDAHIQMLTGYTFDKAHINASALWLKNLPFLRKKESKKPKMINRVIRLHNLTKGIETDETVAQYMAEQWGRRKQHAIKEREVKESDQPKHSYRSASGQTSEASGGNRVLESREK